VPLSFILAHPVHPTRCA